MICYQDERVVEIPDCTMEEIEERIRQLEIREYGHPIDYSNMDDAEMEPTIFVCSLGKDIPVSEYEEMKANGELQ